VPKYLIDANLPYRSSLWSSTAYQPVSEINDQSEDSKIWHYAKEHNLTIVTKDADFSDLAMLDSALRKAVHIRVDNMRMRHHVWEDVYTLSTHHRLVRVYHDRIQTIESIKGTGEHR